MPTNEMMMLLTLSHCVVVKVCGSAVGGWAVGGSPVGGGFATGGSAIGDGFATGGSGPDFF